MTHMKTNSQTRAQKSALAVDLQGEGANLTNKHTRGFTLVEMLVVIAIIASMLTIGALGMKNLSKARGVSAGLPVAEAVFSEARSLAVGKGTKARVLIHSQNDPDDEYHRERFLSYMTVAYEELDDAGQPTGNWVLSSRGSRLPKGVFFVESLSETDGPSIPEMTITLPGNSSSTCFYYEFNSEGLISDPVASGNTVPRFVIRAGSLPPGADEPIANSTAKKNLGGFVIWRSGRTSVFRHPDQIDSN